MFLSRASVARNAVFVNTWGYELVYRAHVGHGAGRHCRFVQGRRTAEPVAYLLRKLTDPTRGITVNRKQPFPVREQLNFKSTAPWTIHAQIRQLGCKGRTLAVHRPLISKTTVSKGLGLVCFLRPVLIFNSKEAFVTLRFGPSRRYQSTLI